MIANTYAALKENRDKERAHLEKTSPEPAKALIESVPSPGGQSKKTKSHRAGSFRRAFWRITWLPGSPAKKASALANQAEEGTRERPSIPVS